MAEEKHAGNLPMVAVNTVSRPELPDLVIHEILRQLPTKPLVRLSFLSKQWEGMYRMLSSVPAIEFDEGNYNQNKLERHINFIKLLRRCLLECKESNQKQAALDKFKLRMTNFYWHEDSMTVTKLLRHSFDRSVKEVDISLRSSTLQWNHGWPTNDYFYGLSRKNLISVKSLTSLKLEFVRTRNLRTDFLTDTCLFPSLKNMSFKDVHFDDSAVRFLIPECPAVEHLSMISCSYAGARIDIPSSSLKSLVIEHCRAHVTYVSNAVNLESVKVVSPVLKHVSLMECLNLKHIEIHARCLEVFHLNGCHDVNGKINATNLISFSYEGHLNSKFSLRAPRLELTRIMLWGNIWDGKSSSFADPWKHFPRLTDFLKEFGCSKEMVLVLHDYKALIFPEDFRKTLSSAILPKVETLDYWTNNIVSANARDREDLEQSLKWMASSVESITQVEYNAEADMYLEELEDDLNF